MRLWYMIDLIFILFLANGGFGALIPSSKHAEVSALNCCSSVQQTGVSSDKRSLRENVAVVSDTEERESIRSVGKLLVSHVKTPTLSKQKVDKLLKSGQSEDAVFQQMRLKDRISSGKTTLFDLPEFYSWIKYANDLKKQVPEKDVSVIQTLTKHLGDRPLYKMLDEASKIPTSEKLANELKAEQMTYWIEKTHTPPEEVFHIYGFDTERKNLFRNPKFAEWMTFIERWNKKHGDTQEEMAILDKYQFDVHDLFKQISEVKIAKDKNAKRIQAVANVFEAKFIKYLVEMKNLDNALTSLQLGGTKHPLPDSFVEISLKIMDGYVREQPEFKTSLMKTFVTKLGHEDVALTIRAGNLNPETKSIANNLESVFHEMLLQHKYTPDRLYTKLGLTESEDSLVRNQLLETWISYADWYYPKHSKDFFSMLTEKFSDRALLQVCEVAKQFPNMKAKATALQKLEINKLFASDRPPKDLFIQVDLADKGETVLTNPLFARWLTYEEKYSTAHPDYKESCVAPLYDHFGHDGVFRILEKAREQANGKPIPQRVWDGLRQYGLEKKQSPKLYFQLLGLRETSEPVLTSPRFMEWKEYVDEFNVQYPEQKIKMIDILVDFFKEDAVFIMLKKAKTETDAKTKDVFAELSMQFEKKMEKEGPNALKELKAKHATPSLGDRLRTDPK